jgi:hypothetical protein
MNDSTKPYLDVRIGLTDTTDYDRTVSLDVERFQRCKVWIGSTGYGVAVIVGTPEQFGELARQLAVCATAAEQAEAAAAWDERKATTDAQSAGGAR